MLRFLFDPARHHFRSHHEGYNGVKAHENGLFLYKSIQGDSLVRSRLTDYAFLFCGVGWVTGMHQLFWLPIGYMAFFMPRKLAVLHYYTFHAELLPHTEQVVFHKAGFFGNVRRIIVDIKNLEKVDYEVVPSKCPHFNHLYRQILV